MSSPLSRRAAMKAMAGAGAGALAWSHDLAAADPAGRDPLPRRRSERIRRENDRHGTRDWLLTRTRIDPATRYRCPWIEGYASHTSVRAGETLTFHVSTRPESPFTIRIFRMGWYGGDGGRLVKELGPFPGKAQPDPDIGPKRLRDCRWTPSASVRIPGDWLSGVYLAQLTEAGEGLQSFIPFIVRDDRKADLLFQCSDHTWQAYNRWPSQFSLYDDGKDTWFWGGGVQVGFNRPYGLYCQIFDQPQSLGSGEFLLWEFPFVHWLEREGDDVTYISNSDTHRNPKGLLRARGFLSVGHDEYWTLEMYRNVEAAMKAGVNLAFFSGNALCGRIRLDAAGRAFERVAVTGPQGGMRDFVAMASLPHERPYANELVGAHSTGEVTGGADWVCAKADHWIHAGTGMKAGDAIPGLIGWEWHGDPAPIPGLEVVATAPTQSAPGKPNGGVYTATVYPGPKGNFVFNASTCWWADGLSAPPGYLRPKVYTEPKGPDARVQRITRNILDRMRRPNG